MKAKGLCNIKYTTANRVWTTKATRRESGFIDGITRGRRGLFAWLATENGVFLPNSNYTKLPVYVQNIVEGMISLLQTKRVITQADVNLACRFQ